MTDVPKTFSVPDTSAVKTAMAVSTTGIAYPIHNGINHLLGWMVGGLKCVQLISAVSEPTETSGTYRMKTFRHPNVARIGVSYAVVPTSLDTPGTFQITAGTGTAMTYSHIGTWTASNMAQQYNHLGPLWDSEDSGVCDIVMVTSNLHLISFSLYDIPAKTLSSGDTRSVLVDGTHSAIRIGEGGYIAESDDTGPHGWSQLIYDTWTYCRPQIIAWMTEDNQAFTTTSASYVDIITGPIKHQARAKKASPTTATSQWWVYSWTDDGETTYDLQVASVTGGSTVALTGLSNTSGAWQSAMTSVAIDNTAAYTITVKTRRTAGSGTVYVSAVSGIED